MHVSPSVLLAPWILTGATLCSAAVVAPAFVGALQDAPAANPSAAAATTPADLYAVGQQVDWIFSQAGRRIGHHWFRYEGATELGGVRVHQFTAGVLLEAVPSMAPEQRYLTDLWVDDRGHPVRHLLRARLGDVASDLDLVVSAGTGHVHLVQGGVPRDLEVPVPEDAFLQMNNVLGYFELMLALQPPPAQGSRAFTLFSANVLKAFPYSARHDGDADAGDADAGDADTGGPVTPGDAFVLQDTLGETLVMDAACRKLLRVSVASQGLVIRRAGEGDEPLATFTIDEVVEEQQATPFDSEEVVIRHGEVSLAGTITRPVDGEPPFAAVFFISGSGPQDRNGRSSGLELGTREVLDRLTSDGFLVLRVDDRGVGASTGPTDGMTFDDLVDDARACVDHLFARDDVDPSRIAIIGHSEGGVTAPLLALERPELAGIVLMAATGRPLLEVIMEQNATALDDQGIEGEEREATLADARRALEWAVGDDEELPAELGDAAASLSAMRPWLRSHARQDPLATISQVMCPVLVLQGGKDFQVSAERDAQALADALGAAGLAEYELVVFPDLDHLFKPVQGEVSRLADYFTRRAVDPVFLDTLSAWLDEHLQPQE